MGHAPVVIVGGSILTSSTANQSVSGTVQVDVRGSVATVIIGGSVATSTTNSSVMLLNSANVIGSVAVLQGTALWNIAGSVAATIQGTPNVNTAGSVVAFQGGTRTTSLVSTVPSSVIVGSSIFGQLPGGTAMIGSVAATIGNFPTTQNVSGSVVSFQGSAPWAVTNVGSIISTIIGSVITVSKDSSILSGQIGTRVSSLVSTVPSSVIVGASIFGQLPAGTAVLGSVATLQGTNPWAITGNNSSIIVLVQGSVATTAQAAANQSVSGTVQVDVRGSVATVIIGGSVATATTNSSVMLLNSANVIGSVTALQGTNPWLITGSVQGSFSPSGNQSVSGAVQIAGKDPACIVSARPIDENLTSSAIALITQGLIYGKTTAGGGAYVEVKVSPSGALQTDSEVRGSVSALQSGNWITSLVSTVPSSVIVGASIFGQLPAGTAPLGSVAVLQGTNPWAVTNVGSVIVIQTGSVISLNIGSIITASQGSVAAIRAGQIGTVITSISGIPQASIHGAVTFLGASVVSGHGSVNGAASVQILAAPGTGLFNYVTDFLLSNTGATTTLVTFTDGDGSIMGKSIAPTGGGAVATAISSPMKAGKVNGVVNIAAATATSVLHAWIGGYKAP